MRPLNRQEQHEGFTWRIDGNTVFQIDPATEQPDRARDAKYALDHVFGPGTTTADIYRVTTQGLIHSLVSGFNATVFAYGARRREPPDGWGGGAERAVEENPLCLSTATPPTQNPAPLASTL